MELFKLLGTIAVDNAAANKALDETSGKGQQAESKLSKAFGVMGKGAAVAGKAIATGLAAGATAMAGLTVKALQASGDLEQNMGGAEAVFGELGKTIGDMKTPMQTFNAETGKVETTMQSLETVSKQAYQNMGLSQSDYLATANKMGALFKGAGFETQEALNLSSQAMQRAADVASIMGIDTEAAMEAVAGAAKGNFTMMDNLGVAMNDTAIAAYAQSKGINKATSEMTQQEKIGLAMEMFLDKTSYAAGNYAKENATLAGSLGTAKAAMQNFLAGSGDVDSIVSSFSNLANVVVRSLTEIAPRLTQGLSDLVQQVVPLIPQLLNQLLPVLVSGATTLINGLVAALPAIISALMNALPALIEGVMSIVDALIGALPQVISAIVSALPTLLPMLIDGIVNIVMSLAEMLPQIMQSLIAALPTIIISIVEALMGNLPVLIEGAIQLVLGIIAALPQIIQALIDALPTVISAIITGLLNSLPVLIAGLVQVVVALVAALPQIFGSLIQAVPAVFQGIWDAVKNMFSGVGEWFSNIWASLGNVPGLAQLKTMVEQVFAAVKNHVTTVMNAVKNVISTVWNAIKNVVSTVLNNIKNVISTAWNAIKTIVSNVMKLISSVLKGDWEGVKQAISNILNAIKSVISSVWNAIKSTISSVLNGIKSVVSSVWNGIKSVISSALNTIKSVVSSVWNGIKGAISNTANGIKTTVVNAFNNLKSSVINIFNSLKTKLVTVGKNLVQGIWNGISGSLSWIKDKITGWVGDVLSFIKKLFGIKSPSRVMRDEVGKMLAEGIAVGIEEGTEEAESAAEKLAKNVLEAAQTKLDNYKVYNAMTLADEVAFWDSVRQQIEEGTEARIEADKKYFEAKQSMNDQIVSAEDTLQKSLSDIYQKVQDKARETLHSVDIFSEFEKGTSPKATDLMKNLDSQINALDDYDQHMSMLEEKIGNTDLWEYIQTLGVKDIATLGALNAMSPEKLQEYAEKYDDLALRTKKMTEKSMSEEVATEVNEAYQTFAGTLSDCGIEVTGMEDRFNNLFPVVESGTKSMISLFERLAIIIGDVGKTFQHWNTNGTLTAGLSTDIEWHDKAMNNPMILNKPTIFGYNSATGKFMGGGETGSEVVSGTNTLMGMIQTAVDAKNEVVVYYLQKVIDVLATYFPQLIEAMGFDIRLDSGALVGELASPMNVALGKLSTRKDRGR